MSITVFLPAIHDPIHGVHHIATAQPPPSARGAALPECKRAEPSKVRRGLPQEVLRRAQPEPNLPAMVDSCFLDLMGRLMLQYLLTHPEHAFSPPETADLCEAFDMTVAALQERGDPSINWTDENVRAALSGAIVSAWNKGERDVRQLSDRALQLADQDLKVR